MRPSLPPAAHETEYLAELGMFQLTRLQSTRPGASAVLKDELRAARSLLLECAGRHVRFPPGATGRDIAVLPGRFGTDPNHLLP